MYQSSPWPISLSRLLLPPPGSCTSFTWSSTHMESHCTLARLVMDIELKTITQNYNCTLSIQNYHSKNRKTEQSSSIQIVKLFDLIYEEDIQPDGSWGCWEGSHRRRECIPWWSRPRRPPPGPRPRAWRGCSGRGSSGAPRTWAARTSQPSRGQLLLPCLELTTGESYKAPENGMTYCCCCFRWWWWINII